jgi:hypothetical protein
VYRVSPAFSYFAVNPTNNIPARVTDLARDIVRLSRAQSGASGVRKNRFELRREPSAHLIYRFYGVSRLSK